MALNLDSILGLLERWDRWKRINATPERIDELEAKCRALEEKLTTLGEGKLICKECGAGPVTVETKEEPYGDGGIIQKIYRRCPSCNALDIREGALIKKPSFMAMSAGFSDDRYRGF